MKKNYSIPTTEILVLQSSLICDTQVGSVQGNLNFQLGDDIGGDPI